MTDDQILEALDRRLAGVESRLPPTAVRPAGAIVVGPTRSRRARPANALPSVIAVAVIVVAVAAGSQLGRGVSGVVAPSGDAPSGSATVAASIAPSPGATSVPLEIIRGRQDGASLLTSRLGWGPCLGGSDVTIVGPDGAAVDRVIDRDGIVDGWVALGGDGRVWVSETAGAAATAFGATILAIGGRGDRWVAIDGKGRQLVSLSTPNGRTMWILTGTVSETSCAPDGG